MKKYKIGTLSLNINTPDFNYGALLHSWAFQKYLEKYLNQDVEVIDYITPKLENYDRENPLKMAIKEKRLKSIIKYFVLAKSYKKRLVKFNDFIKKNMKISEKKYFQSELSNENLKYDILVCESDVIWSPGFFGGKFDKTFFLALDSMKSTYNIAYSPSMADGKLTEEQAKDFEMLLKNIDCISCRESYEKDIVSKYTNKIVTHVMDPVLLLNEEDYDEITAPRMIKENYLLLYLPVDDNKKLRKLAQKYAKRNGLKIIEMNTNMNVKIHFNDKSFKDGGIEEFLSLIKYADMVFTNSFHAICFSIIFKKNFYAFTRLSNGKVRDICKTFECMDYFLENDEININDIKNINYEIVEKIYNQKRNESRAWINNAIEEYKEKNGRI